MNNLIIILDYQLGYCEMINVELTKMVILLIYELHDIDELRDNKWWNLKLGKPKTKHR